MGLNNAHKRMGHKQILVLDLVLKLGRDAYGAELSRQLDVHGFRTALPQVYSILDKLENMGFVTHFMSDPTNERGGRRKKVYRVTASGQTALSESQSDLKVGFSGGQLA